MYFIYSRAVAMTATVFLLRSNHGNIAIEFIQKYDIIEAPQFIYQ